jgi:hypothetical protein
LSLTKPRPSPTLSLGLGWSFKKPEPKKAQSKLGPHITSHTYIIKAKTVNYPWCRGQFNKGTYVNEDLCVSKVQIDDHDRDDMYNTSVTSDWRMVRGVHCSRNWS